MTDAALTVLKVVCSLISICLYLSPIPRLRQVIRNQHTGETPLLPLVCMFCNYHCWYVHASVLCRSCIDQWLCGRFFHGIFDGDYFPLAATTSLGFSLGIIYTCIWIKYTPDRSYAFKVVATAVGILVLITLYAVLAWRGVLFHQTNDQIGDVTGYFAVAATVAFYSSPLATIRKVVRTKSSESLIVQMVFMAVANNGLWSIYAALVSDWFLVAPNSVSFCIGIFQIYLCFKYPNSQDKRTSVVGDLDNQTISIVISPKSELHALPSPTYELVRSPKLTPIHSTERRV